MDGQRTTRYVNASPPSLREETVVARVVYGVIIQSSPLEKGFVVCCFSNASAA